MHESAIVKYNNPFGQRRGPLEADFFFGRNGLCLVPRRLSLSFSLATKICEQRKAGRRKRARQASLPFFTASHGSLRFVKSHSRFALASIRNHAKNKAHEEEAGMAWFARNDPLYQYSSGTLIKRDKKIYFFITARLACIPASRWLQHQAFHGA